MLKITLSKTEAETRLKNFLSDQFNENIGNVEIENPPLPSSVSGERIFKGEEMVRLARLVKNTFRETNNKIHTIKTLRDFTKIGREGGADYRVMTLCDAKNFVEAVCDC